jgi:TM2 domain-containing membrane protein YozV
MAKRTDIDKLPWLVKFILAIIPCLWWLQGINRILRGRPIAGILWIFTGGFFVIGWIIDIICILLYKDIKFLA